MSTILTDIWEQLAAIPNTQEGIRRLRIAPYHFRVYAGWSVALSQPALVLEVSTSQIPTDLEFPRSAGLEVKVTPLKPGRNGVVRITVEAQSDQYSELFPILIGDIHQFILTAKTENQMVRLALSRLHHWQSFLKRYPNSKLTEHEQSGLWGELWFLCYILIPHIGPDAAVSAWQGPDGRNQDFEFNAVAVEVKTTSANPHEKLHISNVRQLEPEGLNALYLYHFALIIHKESGETLPKLIGKVEDALQDSASAVEKFNDKLFGMGYLKSEASWYEKTGYNILSQEAYEVTDGFPRISTVEIPAGVGDIKYSIVLSACTDYRMDTKPFGSEGDIHE
jgi:hypothetical protein